MMKISNKEFLMYKSEIVGINLSTPFVIKGRCKKCGSYPDIYYFLRNHTLWLDPNRIVKQSSVFRKYWTRLCSDHYLSEQPRYVSGTSSFTHAVDGKSYKCRLHKNRGVNPVLDLEEFLTCQCGGTTWAFHDKSTRHRPEIVNRKAKRNFPQKFEF